MIESNPFKEIPDRWLDAILQAYNEAVRIKQEADKMSINDATAADWDRVTKASKAKLDIADWSDNFDPVEKPEHYNTGEIEAIDYIRQQLGECFYAYCEGNVHKYLHRYSYKNGVEDLKKAEWYLDRLIRELCDDRGNR